MKEFERRTWRLDVRYAKLQEKRVNFKPEFWKSYAGSFEAKVQLIHVDNGHVKSLEGVSITKPPIEPSEWWFHSGKVEQVILISPLLKLFHRELRMREGSFMLMGPKNNILVSNETPGDLMIVENAR